MEVPQRGHKLLRNAPDLLIAQGKGRADAPFTVGSETGGREGLPLQNEVSPAYLFQRQLLVVFENLVQLAVCVLCHHNLPLHVSCGGRGT